MKSTVETLSPTRVRLSVEVPFEELDEHVTQAYKTVGAQVKVPGFRPGKAPKAVIDQRVGKDAIYAQATDAALPRLLTDAVRENKVRRLGQASVTELEPIADGQPLSFTAEMDVVPEFTLPKPEEISVTVDSTDITDEQVDAEIENLRLRFGTLKTVERPAADGDFVTIDLKATIDGEEVEGGSATGMSHEVGAGNLLDGVDEALQGLSAEESKTFTTQLAGGDNAGQDADVEVTVSAVKERELPPLDDDFAQLASEHDTLQELRDATREQVRQRAESTQAEQVKEKSLDALVESVELPVPEGFIEEEVKQRIEMLKQQLSNMGLDLRTYLSAQGQELEEFEAEQKVTATQGLRRQLILEKVAEEREVEVTTDQLTAEVQQRAIQQGADPREYAQSLQQQGQLPALAGEIRRALALDEVVRAATIVDDAGTELTNDVLFPEAVSEAEPEGDAEGEAEQKSE